MGRTDTQSYILIQTCFTQLVKKDDNKYQGTTWQIQFKLDDVDQNGPYKLRLALASGTLAELQDTYNVRSVSFHPSGEFLLAGTNHPIAHLYDINTFQCYLSANPPEIDAKGAINQVRYSATGGMYVTASKDSAVRLWDGVSASCVRSIVGAHGTEEATSASFTKDQRFMLSSGKDSTAKLWEVGSGKLVKQYLGVTHTQLRCQAVFNDTEEFIVYG